MKNCRNLTAILLVVFVLGCDASKPKEEMQPSRITQTNSNQELQTRLQGLEQKVANWKANSKNLGETRAKLERDLATLLEKLDRLDADRSKNEIAAEEFQLFSSELKNIEKQISSVTSAQKEIDLTVMRAESKIRDFHRQLETVHAGLTESELTELQIAISSIDDSLNTSERLDKFDELLSSGVSGQLQAYRDAKKKDLERQKEEAEAKQKLAAARATITLFVSPDNARTVISGDNVETREISGSRRTVFVQNPTGKYRLTATLEGYEPYEAEIEPKMGVTTSVSVLLKAIAKANPNAKEEIPSAGLVDSTDVWIDANFRGLLNPTSGLMNVDGTKIIRQEDGSTVLLSIASATVSDDSPAERIRVEKVCKLKALAGLVARDSGIQICREEILNEKSIIQLDATGESKKSVNEFLEITRTKIEGNTKGLPVVGTWYSAKGRIFHLALGARFDAQGKVLDER